MGITISAGKNQVKFIRLASTSLVMARTGKSLKPGLNLLDNPLTRGYRHYQNVAEG